MRRIAAVRRRTKADELSVNIQRKIYFRSVSKLIIKITAIYIYLCILHKVNLKQRIIDCISINICVATTSMYEAETLINLF